MWYDFDFISTKAFIRPGDISLNGELKYKTYSEDEQGFVCRNKAKLCCRIFYLTLMLTFYNIKLFYNCPSPFIRLFN